MRVVKDDKEAATPIPINASKVAPRTGRWVCITVYKNAALQQLLMKIDLL